MEENENVSYVEEKKENFLVKGIKKIIGKDYSLGDDNTIPSSNDTYLSSKYGRVKSTNERLRELMEDIMSIINQKHMINEYACVKEIPIDLLNFEEDIINIFKNKGYTCTSINKNTGFEVSKNYIFISWDIYHYTNEKIDKLIEMPKHNNIVNENENKE